MVKVKDWLRKNYLHIICVAITLLFLASCIWLFPNAFIRIKESFRDLWSSIRYYFLNLFEIKNNIDPSVNSYSSVGFTPFLNLPETWEEFVIKWNEYWKVWATKDNFLGYLNWWKEFLFHFSRIMLLVVVPLFLLLFMLFRSYMNKHNNKYDKDSKPLKFHKWLMSKTLTPVKNWLKSLVEFIKAHNKYFTLWLLIWAWNFNFITILVEFFAYYFYFVISFDITTIYKQFYKLFCDLSVVIATIPLWLWLILGYLFICWYRRKIGYARLNHLERKNCGFINERPICLMVCGTMGKKKTTAITDMALSQETMLKDKAFEKILENDLKFPYFPWVNLENQLKYAMAHHIIYNLATTREYIKMFAHYFNLSIGFDKGIQKSIRRYVKKRYGYRYNNLCFNYDYERYGLYFDDKLKVVDIWQVIETYSQLYFVYVMQTSLIIANYSVRTDMLIDDLGNFPMWNMDFFKKDSRLIDSFSRHAHIIDFDSLRLGRKMIMNNYKKDSFEFGVVNLTEIGKERKNQLELRETKSKESTTNQKNDGFTNWLKMVRHSATIDNYPFVKVITDEQRPESLGADARDLCEIVHIRDTSDMKLTMPFFAITELLHSFIFSKFEKLYYQYRYIRADNTLPMFLFKSLSSKFHNYYNGIYNTFGVCELNCQVESGTMDGQLDEKKYYIMSKKIYSKRFSTDCFSDFFTQKSLKSAIGINDLQEYATEKASFGELREQNSYFITELDSMENEDDK